MFHRGPVSDAGVRMVQALETSETSISLAPVCKQGLLGGFSQTEGSGTPAVTAIFTTGRSEEWPAACTSVLRFQRIGPHLDHLACLLESFLENPALIQ